MASLLNDYIHGTAALLDNYAASPAHVMKHAIAPRSWDAGLASDMVAYQALLGAPKAVDSHAGVYITGQQPGIFTGPLYTIYKAITTLQLAARNTSETGEAFVPVYWVGGDDHDFEEISTVHLLTKQHKAYPLALAAATDQPDVSIFRLPARSELHILADEAAAHAPGSEFAAEIATFLHESIDASENLSELNARIMARLFRDTPLAIFTPELAAARRAAVPIFAREIENPLASTAQLNNGGSRLETAGYGAQVVKDDTSCNFFLEHKGQRCRVRYVDGKFLLPDTGDRFEQADLLALIHESPERFTANVALRCVVQQHLFPVRAYVAGPGELAYWGQLKGVFDAFDTPMPVVYPRIRAVLTSLKTNKLLQKLGLDLEALDKSAAELEELVLRRGDQDPSLGLLAARRAALEATLDGLRIDLAGLGKKGKGAVALANQFAEDVLQSVDHLERNLLRADATRMETIQNQIARLTTELAPDRKPQERYYTLFSWLFQYGWDLIPHLIQHLDHQNFDLQEVEL